MYYLSNSQDDFEKELLRVNDWIKDENIFLEYINCKKGIPLMAMRFLSSVLRCKATNSLIRNDIKEFKDYSSSATKLLVMSAFKRTINGAHSPYVLSGCNISDPLFYLLMSDNEELISWHIKNMDYISKKNALKGASDLDDFMMRTTLLAIQGEHWNDVKDRCYRMQNINSAINKKKKPDYEFLISLANQDKEGMKNAINTFLTPDKEAKKFAKNTLAFLDFYIQTQAVFYGKIASRQGFDLEINTCISPSEIIKYAPLEDYTDPYPFMKEYDWNAPYKFQETWIETYKKIET